MRQPYKFIGGPLDGEYYLNMNTIEDVHDNRIPEKGFTGIKLTQEIDITKHWYRRDEKHSFYKYIGTELIYRPDDPY